MLGSPLAFIARWLRQAKARTKFFLSSYFSKFQYDYREEWLRFSLVLFGAQSNQTLSSRIIQSLADIIGSGKGVLFEWEEGRGYVFKESWNETLPSKEIVIEACFLTQYLQKAQRALELSNDLMQPDFFMPFNWAWLCIPLLEKETLHAFVLLAKPPASLRCVNWEVLDLLFMAGKQAVICLVQEKHAKELEIAKQFEGMNRMSAFVLHDLKNVLTQLSLIQSNARRYPNNVSFIESVYQTIDSISERLKKILVQAQQNKYNPNLSKSVNVFQLMNKAIQLSSHRMPWPKLIWQIQSRCIFIKADEAYFLNILCHLIENAQQATPVAGEVTLRISLKEGMVQIHIEDTGCGMQANFLHKCLAKPFATTKGAKGMGMGVYEAREYLHSVGGKLLIETHEGKGSIFTLMLPRLVALSKEYT